MHLRNEPEITHRERCYVCYRPQSICFCHAIPSIANRTNILILQHVKERFHAFNTARIVRHALQNSTLIVDQTKALATAVLPFSDNTGVLYPGEDAKVLATVPPAERPEQLVILDGTWHHAKTFMRQIPALQNLPRYCLNPSTPSNYRIRKEPTETALSTLEATVDALRTLEPDTTGLDELIAAFTTMIDAQVQHPRQAGRLRVQKHPWKSTANIPAAVVDDLENVVVVYGEAAHGENNVRSRCREPIYWVAQRLGGKQNFECAIQPKRELSESFLQHLQLSGAAFKLAVGQDEFVERWRKFLRPGDTIVAFNQSTLRLVTNLNADFAPSVALKSVDLKLNNVRLDDIVGELALKVEPVPQLGRAGKRLANAIAFTRYLHMFGRGELLP